MYPLLPDLPSLAFQSILTNSLSLLFFFLVFSPFLVNFAAYEQPHCLTEIQSLTFNPTPRCASLAKEMFARKTKATLALWCPGYSETQVSPKPQTLALYLGTNLKLNWGFGAEVVL